MTDWNEPISRMSVKILVVDDEPMLEPLMQQRFRRRIQSGEYTFRFARGGREAMDIIHLGQEVDVLLLDINMPDIDGLTLLAQLSDLLPLSRTIMVSAYGDLQNIRTAMNRGAFDFIMKPVNFQDLEVTIDKTARYVVQSRESHRLKDLADSKARFFDNITHQFRTPLSLIIAPVDSLLQNSAHDTDTIKSLTIVRRNAEQLLRLTGEMLNISKLETVTESAASTVGDLIYFVKGIVETFRREASKSAINLSFLSNIASYLTILDRDSLEKIIRILVSNAISFTPEKGAVNVSLESKEEVVEMIFSNTDIVAKEQERSPVFGRVYEEDNQLKRNSNQSEIGLAFAYELTRSMGGELSVDHESGPKTTFRLKFHSKIIENYAHIELEERETGPPNDEGKEGDLGQSLVLVIESNIDLLAFISESLTTDYRVLQALDGKKGLKIAQRELPDLIISDLAFSGLNGFDIIRQLKSDPSTDHIPIMILTAKSDKESRVESYSAGADDYLTKPFNLNELRLRMRNIIRHQERLREFHQKHFFERAATQLLAKASDGETDNFSQNPFLVKLKGIIESHLDEPGFRTELLAEEMAMSSRTLMRKLNSVAGISPGRLIRTYRLDRGGELLRAGHSVGDAAYAVGFENPSYFATAFKEHYQLSPTEFLHKTK